MAHCDNLDGGLMLWNISNSLKNSSTRTEIAATLLALLPPWAVNMGVDNAATVGKGTKVIEHLRKKEGTELKNANGGLKLGGRISPLHREPPSRRSGT